MDSIADLIISNTKLITDPNQTSEMIVHGNRPGDIAARQKKLAETLPEKPGIIAGRELRLGDKVPCRDGDIIAGVCKSGQTAADAEKARKLEIQNKFLDAVLTELETTACKEVRIRQQRINPSAELALCP